MTPNEIEFIKKTYQPGLSIRLISMFREPQMTPGLEGKVTFVDDLGQLHTNWENGSTLALNFNVDRFIAFCGPSASEYLQKKLFLDQNTKIWYQKDSEKAAFVIDTDRLIQEAERLTIWEMPLEPATSTSKPHDMETIYDTFLSRYVTNAHELYRENPFVRIQNLAGFKKFLKSGGKLKILRNPKSGMTGLIIQAIEVHSNHALYKVFNQPEHELSKANQGRGMRMDFGRAPYYTFGDTILMKMEQVNAPTLEFEWAALPDWYPETANEQPHTEK